MNDADGDDELEVDGEWPDLAGQVLEQLVTEEYWHEGVIASTANAAWIKVASRWHRLYFDCGIIYWRRMDSEPQAYPMPELHAEVRLAEVGRDKQLVGAIIDGVEGRITPNGTDVLMRFGSGRAVTFRHWFRGDEDLTDWIVE